MNVLRTLGGNLKASNLAQGGALVALSLPLSVVTSSRKQEEPTVSEMLDVERQLLIVEDDDAFARTLTRSFERRGYQVVHADSLESMQALLKTTSRVMPWWT